VQAPKAPPAPDPRVVAAAQTQSNKETATANANLNRYNQYGPQGSVEWKVVGTNSDGTPRYEQTTAYSEGEQQVYNNDLALRQKMGEIGTTSADRLGGMMQQDFRVDPSVEAKLYDMGRQRLDPRFEQQRQSLEQQLANKGISMGSDAYDRAMGQFSQTQNDAYNQLALGGREQAYKEAVFERQNPFNEVNALMSGSQVSNPWLGQNQQTNMANTDVAGIHQNAFQNQMSLYNAEMQQQNAMMGGIAGVAGQAMRFIPWSDRRLKKDVVELGVDNTGLMGVEWTYIWGGPRFRGYMADDVRRLYPAAVVRQPNGFDAVDYARIG